MAVQWVIESRSKPTHSRQKALIAADLGAFFAQQRVRRDLAEDGAVWSLAARLALIFDSGSRFSRLEWFVEELGVGMSMGICGWIWEGFMVVKFGLGFNEGPG